MNRSRRRRITLGLVRLSDFRDRNRRFGRRTVDVTECLRHVDD